VEKYQNESETSFTNEEDNITLDERVLSNLVRVVNKETYMQ